MKLSNLIHEIWKDERIKDLGIRKDEIKIILNVVIDKIVEGLIRDKVVKLRGLFTIDVRKIKGRRIANPRSGEEMYTEDYYKLGLTNSKRVKKLLKDIDNE